MNKKHGYFLSLSKIKCLAIALPLLLSACGQEQAPFADAPLYGATIGGEFALSDQNGKKRTYSEFDGQYRIVYFGYTSCPDICSPDMQNLMAGLIAYEQDEPELAGKIQPMFITVDPKRDTPDILDQFVQSFHPRLLGLRGDEDQTAEVAKKFAVIYNIVEPEDKSLDADNNYLVAHTQNAYLMGEDGKPLALLPLDDTETDNNEGDPKLVQAELAKWVR